MAQQTAQSVMALPGIVHSFSAKTAALVGVVFIGIGSATIHNFRTDVAQIHDFNSPSAQIHDFNTPTATITPEPT